MHVATLHSTQQEDAPLCVVQCTRLYFPQICSDENGSCRDMYVLSTKSLRFPPVAFIAVAYIKLTPSYVGLREKQASKQTTNKIISAKDCLACDD